MIPSPTSHRIDPSNAELEGATGHYSKKLSELVGLYEVGEGVMLLESPEGETRVLEVFPRQMIYVPPFWIHRSVNTGAAPLVMSFCYPSDSGQDYSIIERSGGMASRIVADGSG